MSKAKGNRVLIGDLPVDDLWGTSAYQAKISDDENIHAIITTEKANIGGKVKETLCGKTILCIFLDFEIAVDCPDCIVQLKKHFKKR